MPNQVGDTSALIAIPMLMFLLLIGGVSQCVLVEIPKVNKRDAEISLQKCIRAAKDDGHSSGYIQKICGENR